MKIAFVTNDLQLSGGTGVVVQHARRLVDEHGFEVWNVLARPQELEHWGYDELAHLHVASLDDARDEHFDIVIATWWETTHAAFQLSAERYVYFVQSLEDRFYFHDDAERHGALLTYHLPVAFITEARWIERTLAQLRPDADCYYVRNGIDKDVFASPESIDVALDGPLRVMVEGNPASWFKHVPESLEAVHLMREPHESTLIAGWPEGLEGLRADRILTSVPFRDMAGLYAQTDVLLKLSAVEGMYGPPLEAFHMGATCVTTEVTGHDEYVEHGWNALLTGWDDLPGTARQLDLLARDRQLLHALRLNALSTARGWPSWGQSAQMMALALRRIREAPAPTATAATAGLLADMRAGIEAYRHHLHERNAYAGQVERVERMLGLPPLAQLDRLRRSPGGQRLQSLAGRAARRLGR